jgi:hypothetical protein
MVSDAQPSDRALELADAAVVRSKRALRAELDVLRAALKLGVRDTADLHRVHRRYLLLHQRFHALLTTVDIFADALTQRAEHGTGVLLRGLDALAQDGLRTFPQRYRLPPVVCYLDRGLGGAVRRAFTRLPGGECNAVALVRLPRERLCGNGFASLLHEVGHQGNALLGLPEAFQAVLTEAGRDGTLAPEVSAWWSSKISESLADLWACCKLGAAATLGLFAVLGRSPALTFHDEPRAPHPMPWIRARLSAAFGAEAMPHPIWRELDSMWCTLYPPSRAPVGARALLERIEPSLPTIARLVARTRFSVLNHRSLPAFLGAERVAPGTLLPLLSQSLAAIANQEPTTPCQALAVIALGRHRALITPRREEALLRSLLQRWAENLPHDGSPP